MVQMAQGMWYLHERGVAHRDLKPGNVVVNSLTYSNFEKHFYVKVVDFGMSKTKVEAAKSNIMSTYGIGTTRYKAPEVYSKAHLDSQGVVKATWFKADVFSFAMTCAHVLSLKMPFKNTMPSQVYNELKNGQRPGLLDDCPRELVDLLEDCWNLNPSLRPPFIEICTRLETFQYKLLRGFLSNDEDSQGVNYDGGFEFIKDMITDQFMMGEPLVDDNDDEVEGFDLVEVEEFNDFQRNDFVSVILCICGQSLKLLPHAPYGHKEFGCDICSEKGDGEVYHCENCQFDAHRDCAEIKDKVDVFFHHDTLHLLLQNYYDNNPKVTCDFCEESLQGSRWVYSCMQCDFNVHALRTKYSRKIFKSPHHRDPLVLVQSPAGNNATCKCCNGDVKGYWYTCTQKRCSFGGMHPICMILPRNPLCIFNLSHGLQIDRSSGFYCGRCGAEGFSWFYHCKHCNVDIHLDCVHDMEEEECDWNGAYDQFILEFILEYESKANQNVMEMMEELLNMLLVSTGLETSSSSSSSPPPVITRRQPKTGQTPSSSEAQSSNLLGVVSRQSKIGSKTKKLAVKRARQRIKAGWMVELGVKLKNLGEILEDVQGSKVDAEVLAGMHEKLRKFLDFVEESNASKIRQVPRAGLFYSYNYQPEQPRVLTANLCDYKGGELHLGLLCEEPDHEHILRGWSGGFWDVDEHDREQLEKLEPVVDFGLQLVRMALSRATHITTLDSVTLPLLGADPWDLRAIDLDEHDNQTKLASHGDEENVEIQEVAEDAGAEALKSFLEYNRVSIFNTFGLLRVRYTKTEERDRPRYKQGTVAWLCEEHRKCGLEAGVLESYPLRIYHNLEYDQERGFL